MKIFVGFIRKYFGKARELTQLGANRKRESGRGGVGTRVRKGLFANAWHHKMA